jgi:hypothetical protein
MGYHRQVAEQPSDPISVLSKQYPSWRFGSVWASAASGPDKCRLTAYRDGVLLSAWNAAELAVKLRHEEDQGTGPTAHYRG